MVKKKKFSILIVGLGSIGFRHLKNLQSLGYKDIYVYRTKKGINNYRISKKIKLIKNFENKYLLKKFPENSIIFLPYLNYGGSISPFVNFNSKAEIFGILPHHNNIDLLASCYEGIALSIKDCFGSKIKKNDILYLSGGASNSLILPQLISNALNIKVKTLRATELGALGVSYLISSYINKNSLSKIIKTNVKYNKIYSPMIDKSKYLNKKYIKYKKLRESLDKIW